MAEKPYMEGLESTNQAEHISPDKTGDNIQAKRVASYVWNGLSWERATPGSASTPKKTLIDKTTTTSVIYIGEAAIGTATSSATWFITKVDKSTSPISITYGAAGESTNIWDNRATTVVYT